MARWILITLAATLALISDVSSETEVHMQITQRYATVGENITITCEIIDLPPGTAAGIIKVASADHSEPITILNAIVNQDHTNTGRYMLSETPMESTAYYHLNIYNVQHEDTGMFTCGTPADLDRGEVTFEVYRNTEDLSFFVNGTEMELDSLVDMQEGEPIPISCQASKAVPRPKLYILSKDRDITNQFTESHEVVPSCIKEEGCLLHMYYNESLHNSMYEPKWYDNGQQLKCKSIIEEKEEYSHKPQFDIVETFIRLNVTHKPVVNCSESKIFIIPTESATLRCQVFSNPELHHITLYTDDNAIKLSPGESKSGISFKLIESSDLSKPGEMEVKWTNANDRHFTTYRVETSNIIGEQTSKFDVFKKEDGDPNSASLNQISLLSLVLVALVAVFSH